MGTVYQNSKTCDVDTKNLQEAKEENEPEIKQEPWYSILRRSIFQDGIESEMGVNVSYYQGKIDWDKVKNLELTLQL